MGNEEAVQIACLDGKTSGQAKHKKVTVILRSREI